MEKVGLGLAMKIKDFTMRSKNTYQGVSHEQG